MDDYWLTALRDKGFVKETDLKSVLKMIKDEASETYPLHVRRIELLETRQSGHLIELVRTLNTKTKFSECSSFSRQAAITHLFLNITTDSEAKKIAHRILQENPEGDYARLVQELKVLTSAP